MMRNVVAVFVNLLHDNTHRIIAVRILFNGFFFIQFFKFGSFLFK